MPRKSGPRREPTRLKLLKGNPGKQALPKNEPIPSPGIPPRPSWLDDYARDEWDRIVPELDALGLLSKLDLSALVGYVTTWSDFVYAEREVRAWREEHGNSITFATPNGAYQQIPAVGARNKAARLLLAYAAEFGLSPSARSSIDTVKAGQGKDDEMTALLSE